MKRKIIGVTVGSPLPKPNLKQTDPRKGDFVKGKDIIPSKVSDLENDSGYITECSGCGVDVTAQPGQMIIVKSVDENGKPTEWEAVDRTHWAEGGMVEVPIVAEWTEIADGNGDGIPDGTIGIVNAPIGLEIGKTYVVKHNGTDYTVVGQDMSAISGGEMPGVFLGNVGVMEGADGEPFVVIEIPAELSDEAGFNAQIMLVGGKVPFSIYHNSEVVHKLDGKYLPDGVPYVEQGGMVEILPMTELTLNVDSFSIYSKIEGVETGKSYVVNYNGTEYTCIGQDFTMVPGVVILGDMGMFDGEPVTGEPFVFMIYPDVVFEQSGEGANIIPLDGSETAFVSISAVDETLYKIDPRLLPDDLVRDVLVVKVATLDADLKPATANYTSVDIKHACYLGNKAALFVTYGKTLPLIASYDSEEAAEFGSVYFSNGSILRDYVVIDVDGNITTYEIGKTVSL